MRAERQRADTSARGGWFSIFWEEFQRSPLLVTFLAVVSALLIGGIIVAFSNESVYAAWSQSPWEAIKLGASAAWRSYVTLFNGAIGSPGRIIQALRDGDPETIRRAFNPFLESLTKSIPFIFTGLAVALAFRAGLFNLGAEGQLIMGSLFSVFVGYSLKGLSPFIHIPLALIAGALGGALWGFIPGWLKARTGGHEVINTIMMNFIAFWLVRYILGGPMRATGALNPTSPFIQPSAELPRFFGTPIRLHWGFLIGLLVAYGLYWLVFKTRWGFDWRTVGASPEAARYAGISNRQVMMLVMSLSGALAGLAGANQVMGITHVLVPEFSAGYDFNSIAIALIGRSHPLGVVLVGILFGMLSNGTFQLQLAAGVPTDYFSMLQALILVFVAAPALIQTIYRLRAPEEQREGVFARGWGG